jgi:hypothetical protein
VAFAEPLRGAARFCGDLALVLLTSVRVQLWRSRRGPAPLVAELRARGARRRRRNAVERESLRRVIGAVDRCFPSGGNCYRRALVEIAVDGGAAAEPLHLGFRAGGRPQSGHAWLGAGGDGQRYDAELVL